MSVISSNALAGASGQGGYFLTKSLRFRGSSSAFLNRTPASTSNRRTWTWSGWVKIGSDPDGFFALFGADANAYPCSGIALTNYNIQFFAYTDPTYAWQKISTMVLRDPSAWYHIVAVTDTTNGTAEDRARVYVNGQRVTSWSTNNNPSSSYEGYVNSSSYVTKVGRVAGFGYFDGYMSEVNFVDGQALDPSAFGETSTSTGVWIPKKYTGTYGTNGFYLDFEDNSSTAALGYDAAGSNDFTANNISLTAGSTYDSMNDVPTLTSATTANYCVLSPVDIPTSGSPATLSNGNLSAVTPSSGYGFTTGTIAVSSGKWYWEYVATAGSPNLSLGFGLTTCARTYGGDTGSYIYYAGDGKTYANAGAGVTYGSTWTTNDVLAVALDLNAGTATFYKNNVSQGTAFTGLSGTFFPIFSDQSPSVSNTFSVNFGQRPFTYTPPTGFVALNTFNLSTPTIGATASTTANKYFNPVLYTGNGGTQTVSGVGFEPGLVWNKSRGSGNNNCLNDVLRGAGNTLFSDDTSSNANLTSYFTAFTSDGYSFALGGGAFNAAYNYVAWNWRANGAGVSNTNGTITSTVSANTTSGFSIVTYTGTGSNATVGHGLGVAPSMVIVKSRSDAYNWAVFHTSLGGGDNALQLNTTIAVTSAFDYWNGANTSSVFTLGTDNGVNQSTRTYVAYCFAPVAGYSSFGSYVGNASTNGTFVYTGFNPRFVLIKNSTSTGEWHIWDSVRSPDNVNSKTLRPNNSNAETDSSDYSIDFLSNGFKIRNASNLDNQSGQTFIYAAFAENPFKYANAQ